MNYAKMRKFDVSNAPYVGCTLFVSGCSHGCKGCFNEEAQDFSFGNVWTKDSEELFMSYVKNDNVKVVNILGGEPLEQDDNLYNLLNRIKKETNKPIWMWTGFTFEQILKNPTQLKTVNLVDVLVDGPFVLAKKDLMLKYRGSDNQRVIDVKKSLKQNKVIIKE